MLFAESSHSRLKNTPARRSGHPRLYPITHTHARTHAHHRTPSRCRPGGNKHCPNMACLRAVARTAELQDCFQSGVRSIDFGMPCGGSAAVSHESVGAQRIILSASSSSAACACLCVCICSRLARVTSESDVSIVRRRHARRVAAECPLTSARSIGCDWSGSRNTPGR
jgi:hypothetical protein